MAFQTDGDLISYLKPKRKITSISYFILLFIAYFHIISQKQVKKKTIFSGC